MDDYPRGGGRLHANNFHNFHWGVVKKNGKNNLVTVTVCGEITISAIASGRALTALGLYSGLCVRYRPFCTGFVYLRTSKPKCPEQSDLATRECPRQALPLTYNNSVLPQPHQDDSYIVICRREFGYA